VTYLCEPHQEREEHNADPFDWDESTVQMHQRDDKERVDEPDEVDEVLRVKYNLN